MTFRPMIRGPPFLRSKQSLFWTLWCDVRSSGTWRGRSPPIQIPRRHNMWLILLLLTEAAATAPSATAFNVEWTTPSSGPGTTIGGVATYMDAMPAGNGRVTVRPEASLGLKLASSWLSVSPCPLWGNKGRGSSSWWLGFSPKCSLAAPTSPASSFVAGLPVSDARAP